MKKLTITLAGLFLVFSLFLGPSQAAEKEFLVGCNFMLSGPAAFIGIATKQAVDHAAEVINEKGFMSAQAQNKNYVMGVRNLPSIVANYGRDRNKLTQELQKYFS